MQGVGAFLFYLSIDVACLRLRLGPDCFPNGISSYKVRPGLIRRETTFAHNFGALRPRVSIDMLRESSGGISGPYPTVAILRTGNAGQIDPVPKCRSCEGP